MGSSPPPARRLVRRGPQRTCCRRPGRRGGPVALALLANVRVHRRIMEASPPAAPGSDMPRRSHLLQELGFAVRQDGETLHGTASITPYMHVPGTDCLRSSILASWADMLCGLLSMRAFGGRVSVTLL